MLIIKGFKTKLAESEAEPILQELRLGISRDISLSTYQEWLELKIYRVVGRKRQRKYPP